MQISFPIRINRYLALHGYATRRGADELIKKGLVKINNNPAVLGDYVKEKDKVTVRGQEAQSERYYFAYNKPLGVVTQGAQGGEKDIQMVIKRKDIFPIGRLDKNSHGLIVLTNDGRITGPLLDPDKTHEKEYVVTLDKDVTNHLIKWIEKGINIEGYVTKPAKATKKSKRQISIILTEGKKHQIRRMCAAFGYVVRDLKRVRIMNIRLGSLKEGQMKKIQGKELGIFLESLGIEI